MSGLEGLEQKEREARKAVEISRLKKHGGLDLAKMESASRVIEEFKTVLGPLLEAKAFKQALDLLEAKETVEILRLDFTKLRESVATLQPATQTLEVIAKNLDDTLNIITFNLKQLHQRLSDEFKAQEEQRAKEQKTLTKINKYLDQFG